jgi:hypothetical protein
MRVSFDKLNSTLVAQIPKNPSDPAPQPRADHLPSILRNEDNALPSRGAAHFPHKALPTQGEGNLVATARYDGDREAGGWMQARLVLMLAFLLAILAHEGASALQTEIALNFTGTTFDPIHSTIPPDTMGAVGRSHIVEFINRSFSVYRKSDGALVEGKSLVDFWIDSGIASAWGSFDPRIVYDAHSGRWFASSVGLTSASFNIFVAVSNGSDPTGSWTGFEVPADSTLTLNADFVMLGIDDEGVYLSADMYRRGDGSFAYVNALVIPKDELLAPMPTIANATLLEALGPNEVGISSPQPVVDLDGSGGGFLLSDSSFEGFYVRADLGDVNSPTVMTTMIPNSLGRLAPPPAPQPGSSQFIDTGFVFGLRFYSGVILRDGSIWGVSAVDVDGRSALRWVQIDEATNTILQTGIVSDDELSFYYPSIAVNEVGEVVIGFSGSGESQFASAYAVVGEPVDGALTFGTPILLQEGVTFYENPFNPNVIVNRWGDYSATVVDPEDPHSFWTFQEWTSGIGEWSVQVVQLNVTTIPPACDNGLDDDGDGLVDYPDDPGCDDVDDGSENSAALACDDGLDNDGDGLTDFPDDPGCFVAAAPSEITACDDGLDNDGDGFCDMPGSTCVEAGVTPGDPWCEMAADTSEHPWKIPSSCGGGGEEETLALMLPVVWLYRFRRRRRA